MKIKYVIFILCFVIQSAYAERKDATLRDEDISAATVIVEYFTRQDGLIEYVYSIKSPVENKGLIDGLLLDLSCSEKFEPVDLPSANGKEGYIGGVMLSEPAHTPATILADYGSAAPYGITENNEALWGLNISPGNEVSGLRLISAEKPGMRRYQMEPWLHYDEENWLLPEDESIYVPKTSDFTITGMIEGPGCPGKTEPPETARYPGTSYMAEPDEINNLLSYAELQQDRFHVAARTKDITLHIYYANELDAKTFKVEPAWMKRFFNPVAGSDETVILPLKKERNKIKLSAHTTKASGTTRKNNEEHHSFKDTDVFEIRVDK